MSVCQSLISLPVGQLFNFSHKYKSTPSSSYNNEELDVVYNTQLLGVYFESNCRWDLNTKYLVQKSNPKIWFLRRLKTLGASKSTLLEIYKLFVRQALEVAVPVWNSSLTKANVR